MPFSPLDALMQIPTSSRPAEPPVRSDAPAFAPALEQAYQAETPRTAATSPSAPSASKTDAAAASDQRRDSDEPADDAVGSSEGTEQVDKSQEEAAEDSEEPQEDTVEISAEAAAAAGIVQEAKNVEQVVIKASGDVSEGDEVKPIDPKAAADAGASSEHELDPAGEGGPGESSKEESTEPIVSEINSTRRRRASGAESREAAIGADAKTAAKSPAPNSEEATAVKTDAEQATIPQVEKLSGDLSAEDKSEPREQGNAEKGAEGGESKLPAPRAETLGAGDAAAVTSTTSAEKVDVAAEVSGAASVAAATDVPPASADGSQRASSAIERLMAGRSLKSPKEAGEPNSMPTVDRARFVQRVEGAMKAAHQNEGKIQVRLSPPDLGSVKIELAVQNGVLSAKLEAETPAARNLLLDSLPALRERLAQQDIRIEKFDVDVRDQGGNAGSGQADDRTADQSGERQNGRYRPTTTRPAAMPSAPAQSLAGVSSAATGLDIRV